LLYVGSAQVLICIVTYVLTSVNFDYLIHRYAHQWLQTVNLVLIKFNISEMMIIKIFISDFNIIPLRKIKILYVLYVQKNQDGFPNEKKAIGFLQYVNI